MKELGYFIAAAAVIITCALIWPKKDQDENDDLHGAGGAA